MPASPHTFPGLPALLLSRQLGQQHSDPKAEIPCTRLLYHSGTVRVTLSLA